ncbi:LapA family protein [Arthrobacter oryzae]|uniref:LapA family protein n=1 Tax=Arthrobacter oryzae TaxID=409290 RepID=UPI00273B1CA9|nr:lipopolysaccharide assembly protein LapA domain-containing protein [Arthrobacter oryzae]WLQ06375.1 lipopolysaccharide assembly protein LapA domain-containing protein [Arthrobacter oryzae]
MTQQSPDNEPRETAAPSPQSELAQPVPAQPEPAQPGPARPTPAQPTPSTPPAASPLPEDRHVTRAGMVWAAVATALAVMVLLIIFILQNQDYVQVRYFGLEGAVPLGIALFIAAVGGGVLVAVAGAARIIQLRAAAHRRRVLAQRVR